MNENYLRDRFSKLFFNIFTKAILSFNSALCQEITFGISRNGEEFSPLFVLYLEQTNEVLRWEKEADI